MKTSTTILLVLLVYNIFGQDTKQQIIEASYNYNTLQQYVKDHPELDKDTVFQKKYQRYSFWWQHRAASDGSYNRYYNQIVQLGNQSNKNGKTGQVWKSVGPVYLGNNESNIGRVNAIWIDPDDETHIKIGSASAGMWETTNGGTSWFCITPNMAGGIKDFIVHPTDKNIVYGIAEVHNNGMYQHWGGYGIFKSTQGGLNPEMKLTNIYDEHAGIQEILFKPGDPETVFVLANNKVYRLTNGGDSITFSQINAPEGKILQDLAFCQSNPDIGFAYCRGALFRTVDGGGTWHDIYGYVPEDLGVTWDATGQTGNFGSVIGNSNGEYRGHGGRNVMGVFNDRLFIMRHMIKEQNGQYVFIKQLLSFDPQLLTYQTFSHGLAYDPFNICEGPGSNIVICFRNLMIPFNLNNNLWGSPQGSRHQDVRDVDYRTNSMFSFILATDGGVEKYVGSGYPSYINGDLALNEIHGHTIFETKRDSYRVGTHDDGEFYNDENGWHDPGLAINEGAVSWQCQNDFSHYAAVMGYEGYLKVFKNGSEICRIPEDDIGQPLFQDSDNENSFWIGKFVQNGGTVFYKYNPINSGKEPIDSLNLTGMPGVKGLLRFGNPNSDLIFACCYDPWPLEGLHFYLVKSTDGGNSWERLHQTSSYLNNIYNSGLMISDIEINPENDNEIWITFSRFMENGNIRVIHSTDQGVSWENISDSLPDIPALQIEYYPPTNRLFVGTDVGLFEYNWADEQWEKHADFPIVPITRMIINENYRDLTVATYGRGLWRLHLDCFDTNTLVVDTD